MAALLPLRAKLKLGEDRWYEKIKPKQLLADPIIFMIEILWAGGMSNSTLRNRFTFSYCYHLFLSSATVEVWWWLDGQGSYLLYEKRCVCDAGTMFLLKECASEDRNVSLGLGLCSSLSALVTSVVIAGSEDASFKIQKSADVKMNKSLPMFVCAYICPSRHPPTHQIIRPWI